MKVAFDGRYAEGNLAGIGNYIKHLTTALSERGVSCLIFYSQKPKLKMLRKNIKPIILPSKNRYHYEQFLIPRALEESKVDLYHATGNVGIPLFCLTPVILTVHDIIPVEMKGYFNSSKYPLLSRVSYFLRLKSSVWRAKKIITITDFVKKQLVNRLSVKSGKIVVINSGVKVKSSKGRLPKGVQKRKFILNQGGIDNRKNLERLIKAFSLICKDFPKMKLVITGDNPELRGKMERQAKFLELENLVIFPGYVDEDVLWTLIKSASCICYPTLVEGFGAPVLEGFAAGVPVVSSSRTSIPEIADNAAVLVNPLSVNEIARAIRKVLTDKNFVQQIISKGFIQTKKYSWENTVRQTLRVYNEVLG